MGNSLAKLKLFNSSQSCLNRMMKTNRTALSFTLQLPSFLLAQCRKQEATGESVVRLTILMLRKLQNIFQNIFKYSLYIKVLLGIKSGILDKYH